ncbi:MAG: hypothetical protein JSS86_14065 [Cyanobacteria bacterium SZAS LIN-2]|nr:hypothetical protein [Cyanobacteria bacterium SZAS LIN-2]
MPMGQIFIPPSSAATAGKIEIIQAADLQNALTAWSSQALRPACLRLSRAITARRQEIRSIPGSVAAAWALARAQEAQRFLNIATSCLEQGNLLLARQAIDSGFAALGS